MVRDVVAVALMKRLAMAKAVHSPDIRADYHDAIPLNRYGLEQEIAEVIWFLCSDRARYITGQTLAVDGGFDVLHETSALASASAR